MGVGKHHSTACVMDFTANEIVATYKGNKIDPTQFAYELIRAGNWYGTCLIAPESNYGATTISILKEEYPIDKLYKFHILTGETPIETERIGWLTTTSSKSEALHRLCSRFQDEDEPMICPDAGILYEALHYDKQDIYIPNTVKRAKGMTNHFDALIAASITVMLDAFAEESDEKAEIEIVSTIATRRRRNKGYS
jgi:hypothetical protein